MFCVASSLELKVRQNVGNEMRSTDAKQSPVRGVENGGGEGRGDSVRRCEVSGKGVL